MTGEQLNLEFGLESDTEEWLKTIAATCLAHMHYLEQAEQKTPEALGVDDYGLLELERAFLTLYSLYTKGGLPNHDNKPH